MKARKQPKPKPAQTIEEKIDEFHLLDIKLTLLATEREADESRLKELKAELLAHVETLELKPAETKTIPGHTAVLRVTAKGQQRAISCMEKVFDRLTRPTFLANCGFTLGALERLVPKDAVSALVTQERTGPRQLETFSKGPTA